MKTPYDDQATLTHRKHAKPSRAVIRCKSLLDISFADWISQMEEVQAETKRVRKLNEPTIKENRKRAAENTATGKKLHKMLPLPFKMEGWAQERIERESVVKRNLAKRTPQEWEDKIRELSGAIRNRVACLVWWDFFGGRTVKNRWPHLDKWVNAPFEETAVEDVISGLHSVGYSPWEAKKRATTEKDDE
jgi:hypothetical protein